MTMSSPCIDLTQEAKSFEPPRPGAPNYDLWCRIREKNKDIIDHALYHANYKAEKVLKAEYEIYRAKECALKEKYDAWLKDRSYTTYEAREEFSEQLSKLKLEYKRLKHVSGLCVAKRRKRLVGS